MFPEAVLPISLLFLRALLLPEASCWAVVGCYQSMARCMNRSRRDTVDAAARVEGDPACVR